MQATRTRTWKIDLVVKEVSHRLKKKALEKHVLQQLKNCFQHSEGTLGLLELRKGLNFNTSIENK